MTRDVMNRLAGARPRQLDPAFDPVRRDRDLERAVARTQSHDRARRRSARGVVRWTAPVAGLAVAAAAVTVVVVDDDGSRPAPPPVAASPSTSPEGTQKLSARQVLLAAATTAERRPTTDGAYWRVREVRQVGDHQQILESWYGKDGTYWGGGRNLKGFGGDDGATWLSKSKHVSSRSFELADHMYTLAQISGLPTTPKGIVKWANGVSRSIGPSWGQAEIKFYTTDLLIEMLAEAPASSKARAAAFRALAGRPGVKNGGRGKDGQGRPGYALIFGATRYLIDPSTSTLLSESAAAGPKKTGTTYLEVGWTNETPHPPQP